MKRIAMISLIAVFTLATLLPLSGQDYSISKSITDWLSTKKYEGAKRQYTEADLIVPDNVMEALGELGVNPLTIIRNEMYARHGYIFKTPVLLAIYSQASWYEQNPAAGLSSISAMEARNVNWIKAIEDVDDYNVVIEFMNGREYVGADRLYTSGSPYGDTPLSFPLKVELALNHLTINPAGLFRNEIFARHGLEFTNAVFKKIFSSTSWYMPVSTDENIVSKDFNDREGVNLALLREWEWIQILNSVKFSLPVGVTSIPVIGFNALFIKEVIVNNGETYYYSWPDAWTAMEEKGKGLDNHVTNVDALVDARIANAIRAEKDPRKKLILYFGNKKYAGYVDKIQLNHSDMEVPSYLKDAVDVLGMDWYMLLRKEIHARNGAKFIDTKVGPIFKACAWYKAKYDMNPRTLSRFPSGVTVKSQEIGNYSLLEGEELRRRSEAMGSFKDGKIACDLLGNFYYVKTNTVNIAGDEWLEIGHGFTSQREYENGNLQNIVDTLIKSFRFDLDKYRDEEAVYYAGGC